VKLTRSILIVLLAAAAPALAQNTMNVAWSVFGAARYHVENPALTEVAYDDGSWSPMIGVEVSEGPGAWQLAVDFADGAGGTNGVDSIITPQLNLLFADNGITGGLGVLGSYVEDVNGDTDWTDLYFQLNLGLLFPFGDSLGLVGNVHYLFDDFDDISDIDFDVLEYSVGAQWRF
jgi:hypothetical protein